MFITAISHQDLYKSNIEWNFSSKHFYLISVFSNDNWKADKIVRNFHGKLEGKLETQRNKGSIEATESLCQPEKIRTLALTALVKWLV